jgi:phage/plasmid-associated DNA primase
MDVLAQMWDQVFVPTFNHEVSSRLAYTAYVGWCKANGERELSEVKFAQQIVTRFKARKSHTRQGNVWLDLAIADDWK